MDSTLPTEKQIDFQNWEFGIFIHFGIRTFYEGWKDMDKRPMEAVKFDPSALDCRQWVKTAHDAGARYMVFTAKHHDGFANWPSKYTKFSVASSPWKNGKGDVLREYTDACREFGIHPGLYYSPYDHTSPVYNDPKAYDDYFIDQISEILTGYGDIDMLWLDGCGSEKHTYDWKRIIGEIRRMQRGIRIFSLGDPDYRWVGNEDGLAPWPCESVVDRAPTSILSNIEERTGKRYLPAECDVTMRERNWFYSDADEHTVKSLDELIGMYYYSVGRNANLLLNIGPDRRGRLPDKDASRLLEFGAEIKRRFASPTASIADCSVTGTRVEYKRSDTVLIDHVVLGEDIPQGEQVKRFSIRVMPPKTDREEKMITVYEGKNIGHKAICRFPAVRTRRIIIDIHEADGDVHVVRCDIIGSSGERT
ncbi:MAG: alpha-L-fucosidase [Spirochaetota bacterium]